MSELRQSDLRAVRDQLGREPTTPFEVVARCTDGHPLVIRNHPYDVNGDPFPTLYWLTCPGAVRAVARLEAQGWIAKLNERIQDDEDLDDAVEASHRAYASERGGLAEGTESFGGVGGTRTGVKCLHAHYAHHLAGGVDPVGAWVAERVEPIHDERPGRVAAIDQGTNSIRLLVAEPLPDGGAGELARDMVITRLGAGVDATGRLDPSALGRTVAQLERYCRRARALHAERIRVGATSAVRDAANREEIERAVGSVAGVRLEILDGEREGGLSFLGATQATGPIPVDDPRRELGAPRPFLVLDIGGGSTEFVVGDRMPEAAASTQMGSVRLTERHVHGDPPSIEEIRALEADVDLVLANVAATVPVDRAETLVAVAGTATTIQAMALDLPRYDPEAIHRTWLAAEAAESCLERLAAMTNAERAALPFMAPGRGDVIVAGALVLVKVMHRFGFARALVSETDVLDGLALEMLRSP